MTTEIALDRAGALAAPKAAWIYEGVIARVHRPGDPLVYPHGEEFRTPEQLGVMRDHVAGKPFVRLHPAKDEKTKGLVALGAKAEIIGQVLDARIVGDELVARILVDGDHVDAIDDMQELSLGYLRKVHKATREQHIIAIDHLALVPQARCGAECALRTDAADELVELICESVRPAADCACHEPVPGADQGCACKSLANPLDGRHPAEGMIEKPAESATGAADSAKDPAMDELKTQITELTARATKAEQERDAHKVALDAAELTAYNARKDLEAANVARDAALAEVKAATDATEQAVTDATDKLTAQIDTRVAERLELLAITGPILDVVLDASDEFSKLEPAAKAAAKNAAIAKMSPRAIKIACVQHIDGESVADGKSNDFVDGVFDGAMKRHTGANKSVATARRAVAVARHTARTTAPVSAKQAVMQATADAQRKLANGWKTKSSTSEKE